jgi:hypothetical protein
MIESEYYMTGSNSKQNINKMSMDVRQDLVPEVLMAEPGDALPLLTHAPAFMLRRMGQRTANPGAQNTLTVTLAANVNLQGDSITICGLGALSGSVTLESCNCKQADEVEGVDLFTVDASNTNRIRLTFKQSIAHAKGVKIVFALGVTNPDTGVGLDSPNQITVEFPFVEAGYGVGFDTLEVIEVTISFFGWFGSKSLGALCTLHPPPRPCLHARGGMTLADVTAGCCSHLPCVPWMWW